MNIKVDKNAVLQYVLIYIMLLVSGSCFYWIYIESDMKYYILFGLFLFLTIKDQKYRCPYGWGLVVLFLGITLLTRAINGGAGIASWLYDAVIILATQSAICCNQEKFLSRWLNIVICLAIVSCLFWMTFCIAPGLVNIWPTKEYVTQVLGTVGYQKVYTGKGLLLYSHLKIHATRNTGIFAEPGKYQIVLNSALFILLFWREKVDFRSIRQYKIYLLIILITIVSCQSTTGYIAMAMILLCYFIRKNRDEEIDTYIKRYLLIFLCLGMIVLGLDFILSGKDSIIYSQIIVKLFGENGTELNLSESSGQYRIMLIWICLEQVIRYPFGVGNTVVKELIQGTGASGAALFKFLATYGIVAWIAELIYLFYPVAKYEEKMVFWLVLILFVNTTLAQTDLIYTAQLMIPMYLEIINGRKIRVIL